MNPLPKDEEQFIDYLETKLAYWIEINDMPDSVFLLLENLINKEIRLKDED